MSGFPNLSIVCTLPALTICSVALDDDLPLLWKHGNTG